MSEIEEFDEIVARYKECRAVKPGRSGCACLGNCLGYHLARLRKKYDFDHPAKSYWWSDQAHGRLKKRVGDSGRDGAALNAENYWNGVK